MHPPLRLFGRTGELEIMGQLIANAQRGRSAVLVVRGEPGIGKTELLRQLTAEASGFAVARVAGVESEMELPFAGLHQLCAPMLGRLGSLAEPQRRALSAAFGLASGDSPDRFMVCLAALSLMAEASEKQPILCVVDDAQWLDQASAHVLGFVGRRLLAEPVALVFAVRTPAPGAPATDHLAGLPELQLGGLDEQSARALLATVISGPLDESVRVRILEETHGHPLALLELYRGRSAADLAGGFALPDAGDLPRRIEDQYAARLGQLPAEVRRLVLLAAADPVGDPALILRAAELCGLDTGIMNLAAAADLLEFGANVVRFRHPLVRSAAYRAATADGRRAVHEALAAVTDPLADPDRRAWHRAHATAGPDEAVAEELISSASRAMRRGGVAAAAAFWERAVALTPDPGRRASRALTAAEAKYAAGDFEAAQALLVTAEAGPPGELGEARAQRMRAQVAFALRRGGDAPPLMLRAAQRLQSLDAELARQTYLEALVAAIYAGRLAQGQDARQVARAARSAALPPSGPEPLPHSQLLIGGLAVRLADGYVAAAPALKEALRRYRAEPLELDWLSVSYDIVAMDMWDDEAWFELAAGQLRLARANGTLSWLPFALDYLAEIHVQAGELSTAAALLMERERVDPGTREATLPYVPLLLAAWRGDATEAAGLAGEMTRGASDRGEGAALTYTDYARAVLYNGQGNYRAAAEAAAGASGVDEIVISPWALVMDAVPAGSGGCGAQPPQDGGKGTQPPYRPPPAVTSDACEALSSPRFATEPSSPGRSFAWWTRMPNTSTRCSTPKLDAIGYGFLVPVFFVTSGLMFNLSVLFSSASTLRRVPLFLLALLVVRGLPAVLYRSALASIRDVAAVGLLQATSLPFIVAATTIGLQVHAIRPANAAALIAAGLSASSFSRSARCSCCDRRLRPGCTAQRCGQHAS